MEPVEPVEQVEQVEQVAPAVVGAQAPQGEEPAVDGMQGAGALAPQGGEPAVDFDILFGDFLVNPQAAGEEGWAGAPLQLDQGFHLIMMDPPAEFMVPAEEGAGGGLVVDGMDVDAAAGVQGQAAAPIEEDNVLDFDNLFHGMDQAEMDTVLDWF